MDGVLEGAVVLCVCKLTCSLLFLPSLTASNSPVSFCCCCLLIFTDFLVTVFLSFLSIFESWLTELSPPGDVIALRFLLFLSHTYGAVLLLTTFLILLETLIRLLWPHLSVHHRTAGRTGGQRCYIREGNVKEVDGGSSSDTDSSLPQIVGFFCCLSVWFIVALNVRWHWRMEEAWAAVCLHTTDSLVRCLPSLLSAMPSTLSPYWIVAFLFFLLVLLIISTPLPRRHQATEQMQKSNEQNNCCWPSLVSASAASLRPVHPGMLVHQHGDLVLTDTHYLLEKRGEQEQGRTKKGLPVSFISEGRVDSQPTSWSRLWGLPGLEDNLILALLSVLSVFTLPFNLSVNILLIRTIDSLLDRCIRFLLSSSGNTRDTSITLGVTQV